MTEIFEGQFTVIIESMKTAGEKPVDWAMFEQKNAVRAAMRLLLERIDPADRRERSRVLIDRLTELPAWKAARRVLLFAPLPTEPDIDPLWTLGTLADKECAYPRVEGMVTRLYYVHGLADLEPTRWQLREPVKLAAREADIADFDVVLVPGLAFDALGGRLGRGGGFYDRLLAGRSQQATLVGVCFAAQRVEQLPLAPHDVLMDMVYTESI